MNDPCAFSPHVRQARRQAHFYVDMFPRGALILELGFGQGYFLEAAQSAGLRAIGIDRDPALVRSATQRGLEARHGDVREVTRIVPEQVDGVFASHLIEHLHPDEVRAVLAMLSQVVKPGGILILSTPNFRDWRVATEWFWLDPTHVRPYPAGAVQQLLDPGQWVWATDGFEPMVVTRHWPGTILRRLRFGADYGRPGSWYKLIRRGE